MKEIISYVGGGFLAVMVGVFFLQFLVQVLPLWGEDMELTSQEREVGQGYDHVYAEVIKKGDITVKFIGTECIMGNEFVDLQSRFVAYDGTGQKLSLSILSVVREETEDKPLKKDGKYCFFKGGIYRVYIRCENLGFVIRIPVNVFEEAV